MQKHCTGVESWLHVTDVHPVPPMPMQTLSHIPQSGAGTGEGHPLHWQVVADMQLPPCIPQSAAHSVGLHRQVQDPGPIPKHVGSPLSSGHWTAMHSMASHVHWHISPGKQCSLSPALHEGETPEQQSPPTPPSPPPPTSGPPPTDDPPPSAGAPPFGGAPPFIEPPPPPPPWPPPPVDMSSSQMQSSAPAAALQCPPSCPSETQSAAHSMVSQAQAQNGAHTRTCPRSEHAPRDSSQAVAEHGARHSH